MRTVIGVFDKTAEAEGAIYDLERDAGAKPQNISVITKDPLTDLGDIHLNAVDVRGYGRLCASGPMSTYLTQSIARGQADVIVDALIQMGLTVSYAESYVDAVRRGLTLEAVTVDDDKVDEALAIMREHTAGTEPGRFREGELTEEAAAAKNQVIPLIVEEFWPVRGVEKKK